MTGAAGESVILVTGGAGFIGQNLVHLLAETRPGRHFVVLDALTYAANPLSLQGLIESNRITFQRGDIRDLPLLRELFRRWKIDAVAHLAAESHVDRSIATPDAFIETNIIGTYNLLKCALASWKDRKVLDCARFLHVSTDEVFGDLESEEPAFTENTPYRPSSPYSASKASSDHLARACFRTYGLPVIVTNCSNNYGPYQHPEKLIPLMIIRALQGQTLPVYGNGSNIRDWLFVGDHCRALDAVLQRGIPGATYNIGGGAERTNNFVVSKICEAIDARFRSDLALETRFPNCPSAVGRNCASLIGYVTDRPGHDRRYAIDASFLKRELGMTPVQTLESGLKLTVDWYIDNEPWWRRAMSSDFTTWIERNYGGRTITAAES